MRVTALAVILVPLLATAVLADLAQDVRSARDSLTSRASILGGIVDPTKTDKKELKRLGKALDALADYLGLDDADDLARCYKAVKSIVKSKTVDASCLDALEDIKDSLDAIAGEVRGEVLLLLPTVVDGKEKKVRKYIDRGDENRSDGHAEWPANPKKCIKELVKAVADFRKAVAKAQKYQEEPPPPTAEVYIYSIYLINSSAAPVEITDVTFAVTGTLGGQPYSYGGKASDLTPQLIPVTVASGSQLDLFVFMRPIVNSDPGRPQLKPGDVVSVTYTIHTTAGDFSSGM